MVRRWLFRLLPAVSEKGAALMAMDDVLRVICGEALEYPYEFVGLYADGTGPSTRHEVDLRQDAHLAVVAAWQAKDRLGKVGGVTFSDLLVARVCNVLAEDDPERLRDSLVQVAAWVVFWINDFDQRQVLAKDRTVHDEPD